MSARFERLGGETLFDGKIATVRRERFRYEDGSESEREVILHPGAVAIVAHDGSDLILVRQPREAVGEPDLLELPAGKLDVEGEEPLATAQRELIEETGFEAGEWRELKRFYTTPGFAQEEVVLFEATGLSAVEHEPHAEERIDVVRWPLADLAGAIEACRDAKSLIGLLILHSETGNASTVTGA